jgi:hypothetical protein
MKNIYQKWPYYFFKIIVYKIKAWALHNQIRLHPVSSHRNSKESLHMPVHRLHLNTPILAAAIWLHTRHHNRPPMIRQLPCHKRPIWIDLEQIKKKLMNEEVI